MQTGYAAIDNELQPVYEFRHLTFQEYLAARGYAEEQYPGRGEGGSLVDQLGPHFEHESWQEVILLAAVLAGRKAEEIIKRLTTACSELAPRDAISEKEFSLLDLLLQCLLDEVQVTATTLREAFRQVALNINKPPRCLGRICQ